MFRLSIVDHIRLSFGHVVQNYTVHMRAAERQAAAAMYARTVVPALLACAAALSVAVLLGAGRYTQIASAVASAMAFLAYAVVASLGLEERMLAHRFMANRLWMLCERYRALLAEIHDGLLEPDAIRMRRDDLIREFHQIVEQAALPHRSAQGAAGRAAWSEASLTEAQIDQFLPESLRQTTTPAPAEATAGNG